MGPGLIALFVAAGGAAWSFSKLQDRAGYGNNKPAVTGAILVFVIAFIVIFTIAQSIF